MYKIASKVRNILLIAVILATSISPVFQSSEAVASGETSLNFALMTDSHIGGPASYSQSLKNAVGNISPSGTDFVVHLGDAINGDSTNQTFDNQWGNLTPIMSTLPQTLYYARGNHDLVSGWTDADNIAKWITKSGMSNNYYSFDNSGFHFVVLDLVSTNATETNWLTNDLAVSTLPTIVFTHYPIIRYDGMTWMGGNAAYQTILENDGDVIAVFNGHLHENAHKLINGIDYYALSNTYTDGAFEIITAYTNNSGSFVEVRGFGINDSYSSLNFTDLRSFYTYSRVLTINATTIGSTLTNYPVRVSLNASNFNFAHVTQNASDIRFFGSTGNALNFDIEYWDNVAPEAIVWVKIPSITANSTYNMTMLYGNTNAGNGENRKDTWGTQTVIDTMNGVGNFTASTGGNVTANATGLIGVYFVQNEVLSPSVNTTYNATYDPPGTINMSATGAELISWVTSNLTSTGYNYARLYVVDTNNNSAYWGINVTANSWNKTVSTLISGANSTSSPNLSSIDKLVWSFNASSTNSFKIGIDLTYLYVGYNDVFHFNEGTGLYVLSVTRLQDYDTVLGVLTGNATWSSNHSLLLENNGYVNFVNRDQYNAYTRGFTIDAVVSQNNTISGGVAAIVAKDIAAGGGTANVSYRLHTLGGIPRLIIHDGVNNLAAQAATAIATNASALATSTFDMANMLVYKDGVAGTPTARTAVSPVNYESLKIGASQAVVANNWSGIISEVRMINVARDAQWIKADNLNFTNTLTSYGSEITLPAASTLTGIATMDKDGLTSANLTGNLTSLGGDAVNSGWFEYGLTTSYGNTTANTSYNTTGNKTAIVSGLTVNQTYHFRFVSQGTMGTVYGSDGNFTFTMPTITTLPGRLSGAAAILNGNIGSMGAANSTYIRFNWGYDTNLGTYTANQTFLAAGNATHSLNPFNQLNPVLYRVEAVCGNVTVSSSIYTINRSTAMDFINMIETLAAVGVLFGLVRGVYVTFRGRDYVTTTVLMVSVVVFLSLLTDLLYGVWG